MNSVADRSVPRAVTSGLSGLLAAMSCVALPAVSHAGVDGAAHVQVPIAARAKFMAANEFHAVVFVMDKYHAQAVDADPADLGPALTTYLDLHGRALDAARATLLPLMAPVPQ